MPSSAKSLVIVTRRDKEPVLLDQDKSASELEPERRFELLTCALRGRSEQSPEISENPGLSQYSWSEPFALNHAETRRDREGPAERRLLGPMLGLRQVNPISGAKAAHLQANALLYALFPGCFPCKEVC
jgi:hypothetical protein